MAYPQVDSAESERRKEVIEDLLRKGYTPPRIYGGVAAVIPAAAEKLGVPGGTLMSWIGTQEKNIRRGLDHFMPDWRLYVGPQLVNGRAKGQMIPSVTTPKSLDPAKVTKRTLARLQGKSKVMPDKPTVGGQVQTLSERVIPKPEAGIRYYLLTSAQNNTHIHEQLWTNLLALREHLDAELFVGTFTYNKNSYGPMAVKRGTHDGYQREEWYTSEIIDYIVDDRVEIGPGLVWCGEANIVPTADFPLRGLEDLAGRRSNIVPHAKHTMVSVASGKYEAAKLQYTTGTCTLRNYLQKKEGLKAEQHHTYGALLVEVDADGDWFVRQLAADEAGTINDLNIVVENGVVREENNVEAISWGDIHAVRIDPQVKEIAFAPGGMLDTLKPRYQFMHDLFDMHARNHWETRNPHSMYERYIDREDSVEWEVNQTKALTDFAYRDWCQMVVVRSNHDEALDRWLVDNPGRYAEDLPNAEFFLEAQLEKFRAIRTGNRDHDVLEWALKRASCNDGIIFNGLDENFVICDEQIDGGIECGMHGDKGPSGARGSYRNIGRSGRRASIGHSHAAAIWNGVFQAGTSSLLDMRYNRGLQNWSHSHIVTYKNGQRTIVTFWGGKYRASPQPAVAQAA